MPAAPWARRMVILVCAVMPLLWNPWGFQQRLPVAWLAVVVAVPLGLSAIVRRNQFVWARPGWWLLAFLGVMGSATLFGIAPLTSLIGESNRYLGWIGWFLFFLAFVLGLQVGADAGARAVVQRSVTVGACGVALLGLAERGERIFSGGASLQVNRVTSTFRNAAFLGSYLVLVIPITASVALDKSADRRWRILGAAATALSLVALLATQTRAAWLGTLAAFVTIGALAWRGGHRRATLALGATVAVLLAAAISVAPLRDRAFSIGRTSGGSNAIRVRLWDRSLALAEKRPLLGYGPDALGIAFPRVIDDRYEIEVTRETSPDRAHNLELDLLLWGGVGAVIAAAGWIVSIIRVSKPTRLGPEGIALAAALVGYLVQLQMSFSLADVDVMAMMFAGILVSASAPPGQPRTDQPAARRLVAGVLSLTALGLGIWHVRAVLADRELRLAVDIENTGNTGAALAHYRAAVAAAGERTQFQQALGRFYIRIDDGPNAVLAIDNALRIAPGHEGYLLDRASGLALAGRSDEARVQLDHIIANDPSSSDAWLKRGVLAAQQADYPTAKTNLLRAQALAPLSAVPSEQLGLLAKAHGDVVDARKYFAEALDIDSDSQVAQEALHSLGPP